MFKKLVSLNDGKGYIVDEGDLIYKPSSDCWYIITEVKYVSTSEEHAEVLFTISHKMNKEGVVKSFEITPKELIENFHKLVILTQEEEDDLLSLYWDYEENDEYEDYED